MIGILEKNEQAWLINHDGRYIDVDTSDYKYLNDMWIGDAVEFTVITIADGTSEWDIMDKDVAKITFEANLFQNELHNNFIVSADYRNERNDYDVIFKDLSEDLTEPYKSNLQYFMILLKEKGYKIVKKS
jgi:hypothetical protein